MWGDIIPAFNIPPNSFNGLNNTPAGLAILENGCEFVTPTTTTQPGATTTTQPGATTTTQPGAPQAPSAGAAAAVVVVPRVTG
jgi:hypothetical protein